MNLGRNSNKFNFEKGEDNMNNDENKNLRKDNGGMKAAIQSMAKEMFEIRKLVESRMDPPHPTVSQLDILNQVKSSSKMISDSAKRIASLKPREITIESKPEKHYMLIGHGGMIQLKPILITVTILLGIYFTSMLYFQYNGEKEKIKQEYQSYKIFYEYFLYQNYYEGDYEKTKFMINKLSQIASEDTSLLNDYELYKTHFDKSQQKILLEKELEKMKEK